jgi:hypothetical protein
MIFIRTIDDAFSLLGAPQEQATLPSFDDPYMHRATWQCGCIIDFVHEHAGAFAWTTCAYHQAPEAEFWGQEEQSA